MVMSSLTWASRRYWRCVTSTDSKLMDFFQNDVGFFSFFCFLLCSLISSPLLLPPVWGTSSGKHVSSRRWALLPGNRCSKTKRNEEAFGDTLITLGPTLLLPFFLLLINCWWMVYGDRPTASEERCLIFPRLVDMWKAITVSINWVMDSFLSWRFYVMQLGKNGCLCQ